VGRACRLSLPKTYQWAMQVPMRLLDIASHCGKGHEIMMSQVSQRGTKSKSGPLDGLIIIIRLVLVFNFACAVDCYALQPGKLLWGTYGGVHADPVIDALAGVKAASVGSSHGIALLSDSSVVCWGNNIYAQTNIPFGLTNVAAVAAGGYLSMALQSNGTVIAWGDNRRGQTNVPVGLRGVAALSTSGDHCLALLSNCTVVAGVQGKPSRLLV
jgi:hypothetical protein